jgi:hypothetical protein
MLLGCELSTNEVEASYAEPIIIRYDCYQDIFFRWDQGLKRKGSFNNSFGRGEKLWC